MKSNLNTGNSVSFVAAMDSPRIGKYSYQIKLYTLNKLKNEHLRFDVENPFIARIKNNSYKRYQGVGEIGLFEIYGESEFCHLFFDVDHLTTTTEIDNMIRYFDNLQTQFGKYSIGCYTNDESLAIEKNIPFIDESEKFFSAHVVFYESKISKDTFKKWFKPTDAYTDPQTWKDVLNGNARVMRFAISNKIWKNRKEYRAGKIVDSHFKPLLNTSNLVSIRGSEFELVDAMFEQLGFVANDPTNNPWDKQKEVEFEFNDDSMFVCDEDLLFDGLSRLETIHNYTYPSLFLVFSGLNALSDVEDERRRLYNVFYQSATDALTDKAKANFDSKVEDMVGKRGNKGCLINLLKLIDNGEWFMENFQNVFSFEQQEEELKEHLTFKTSDYTFDLFQKESFDSLEELLEKLRLCVAINLKGGYILRTNEGYLLKKLSDITADYNRIYTFEDGEVELEAKVKNHKNKSSGSSVSLSTILKTQSMIANFESYNGTSTYTRKEDVLSLWIPPMKTDYNKDFVLKFINYYITRAKHEKPIKHFFDCLAFKLRNPESFLVKFFIQYGTGHDGKTMLIELIDDMFGNFSMIGTQAQFTKDEKNSWQQGMMFEWMEEAEDDYGTKNLSTAIKLMTSRKIGRRGMYKELAKGTNSAIVGMNTNKANLNGLKNCEKAVKDRLVIIEYKEDNKEFSELVDGLSDYILANHEEFIYSFYYYLLNDHPLDETNFTTERYDGEEKKAYIENINNKECGIVGRWIKQTWLSNQTSTNALLKQYMIKNQKCFVIDEVKGNAEYVKFVKESSLSSQIKIDWKAELVEKFNWKKYRPEAKEGQPRRRFIYISKEDFEKFLAADFDDVKEEIKEEDIMEGWVEDEN